MPTVPVLDHPAAKSSPLSREHPIRLLREARGLTASDVAAAAGLTKADYSRIERGHRLPSLPTMLRLAEAVGARELVRVIRPWIAAREEREQIEDKERAS